MIILINGELIKSTADFYNSLTSQLDPKICMGQNFHALWDVMGFGVERPIELTWINSSISEKNLGKDFTEITNVLKRVEASDIKHRMQDKFILNILR